MNLHQKSIDYRNITFDTFLANLQGNILKGHGRDNTVHFIIKFKTGKSAESKAWTKMFAEEKITSLKEQLRQRELFKRKGTPGGLFAGIYFTNSFYTYLGLDTSHFENGFRQGMKHAHLSDPPVTEWEKEYQGDFHAMILLAHDNPIELGKESKLLIEQLDNPATPLQSIADIITIEYGSAIRNANGDGLEHFGYVDGISQPLFLKDEVDRYVSENIAPIKFDPAAELDLVLFADPLTAAPDSFGSYFVYRKLEQDVRGFNKAEESVADTLGLSGDDRDRAGAMIVGRFEDGTPVTISGKDKMISSGIMNNFDYKESIGGHDDSAGARCPFHAHVRKVNPRRNAADKSHIMARRGIPYGHRNVSTTISQTFVQMPKSGIGLLFMSFQKSIQNQFEFIQTAWANNAAFPSSGTGVDDIIGQGAGSRKSKYAKIYNDSASMQQATFNNFVTLKGGEYFFAPSIPFLLAL